MILSSAWKPLVAVGLAMGALAVVTLLAPLLVGMGIAGIIGLITFRKS